MMNLKEPNSRLTRWRLKLSEYDFTVVYKQGKSNTNADALSRIELHNEEVMSIIANPSSTIPSLDGSRTMTAPEVEDNSRTATVHPDIENPILEVPITEDPLNKFTKQIIFNVVGDLKSKPVISKPFDTHTRISLQISESNLEEDVVNSLKEHVNPKTKTGLFINPFLFMYKIIPIIQKAFKNSAMNLLLTKKEVENVGEYLKQQEIISKYHEGKTNHRGINECYLALSHKYYWPKMKEHITKFINECKVCGQAKYDRNPIKQHFKIVPSATKPFDVIHLDVLTIHSEKFLTIVDAFSKYGQAYYLRDGTAISVLLALLNFCTHHGMPVTIISDNGTEFTNQILAEFFNLHNIHHHRVAPHTPNENGIVERFHLTILEHLRILKLSHKLESVMNLMPYAILAYNNSIHSLTKCKPLEVITGHFDPRDPFDMDISSHLLQQYMVNHKDKMKIAYNTIQDVSNACRKNMVENLNKNREPEIHYTPEQQIFVKNPLASRQKLAPRYTQDVVMTDLPIHIYTKRNRGPVAKSRLKRVPKGTKLLQATPGAPSLAESGVDARDLT